MNVAAFSMNYFLGSVWRGSFGAAAVLLEHEEAAEGGSRAWTGTRGRALPRCYWIKLTVFHALEYHRWVKDTKGRISIQLLLEYIRF
jgi:hypothetical protein